MSDDREPPIREFADRGTLWLLESPDNLKELVRLLSAEIADRLDFSRALRINRSFIPDDLHKQEADLLFQVPFRQGRRRLWIYVLLEHQSKPDRTMGLRLLSYMVEIWQVQIRGWQDAKVPVSMWKLHPVLPIVFYTGKRRWIHPISLSALMEIPELLNRYVPQEELAHVLTDVAKQLDRLPEGEQASWKRAMQYLYLLIWHTREPEEQEALFEVMEEAMEQHREEMQEVKMTGAQVLLAQGRREGRAEGERVVLLRQLRFKFGVLSEETEARVEMLTQQEIAVMLERILMANTLAELGL